MSCKTDWLAPLDRVESAALTRELASISARRGGVIGEEILSLINKDDFSALVNFPLDCTAEWDVNHLINCRQALAFYQKREDLVLNGVDKEATAFRKWKEAEAQCKITNNFLRGICDGKANFLPPVCGVIYSAKRKIARVLGRCPNISELNLAFGPGATNTIAKKDCTYQMKLAESPSCSDLLAESLYLVPLLETLPHYVACHKIGEFSDERTATEYDVVELCITTAHLQFVPKSALTYRAIDVQPTLNTLFQGGVGKWMERRLRSAGIDISNQELNQKLARKGSIDDSLATIDLSSASDTVAIELVRFLLPDEWFRLLRATCCSSTVYAGTEYTLAKFSSMGSGVTFPLETLIFWALASSACEGCVGEVRAYGDDLIVPRERFDLVVHALQTCGFSVNKQKSFKEGPFRESCGADFYLGINIRPFYQKTRWTGETIFTAHNFFFRLFEIEHAEALLKAVHPLHRIFGPDGYGDGHLLSYEWDSHRPRKVRRDGWGGSYFRTFARVGKKRVSLFPGDYVTPLYLIYVRGCPDIMNPSPDTLSFEKGQYGRPLYVLPGASSWTERLIYTLST